MNILHGKKELQKNLEKFFVYFFASVSMLVVILGIGRIKQPGTLGTTPAPSDSGATGVATTAKATATMVAGAQVVNASGKTFQTPWGNLATTIQVKDGKVVAVNIPTLPDSPPSVYAKQYLIDQALRSGSSNIQGVSGATITSNAFKASLESALAQAATQGITVTGGLSSNTSTGANTTTQTPPPAAPAPTPKITAPTIAKTTSNTASAPASVSGTFTGSAYQTPWGNAVASVTFTNGKITNVTMPQVPNSPPSQQAEPYLIQQAMAAGSANIQGVSGATYASIAFKSSLESAIAKASAQGTVAASVTSTSGASATKTTTAQPTVSRTYKTHSEKNEDFDD